VTPGKSFSNLGNKESPANVCACPGIYNASKAALIQAGGVWRLEMAPLGVRVLTLITGGVQTKFLSNATSLELPEDSYYRGIKDIILDQSDHVQYGVSLEVYAREVVQQIDKGTTGKCWIGGGAGIARLALGLFPQRALVSIP
jgi:1-acylglycerone phosphate reductase